MEDFDKQLASDSKRWENRRKMAWQSFAFLIGFSLTIMGFLFFADGTKISAASAFEMTLVSILGVFGGIVMAYIGSATYSDVKLNRS